MILISKRQRDELETVGLLKFKKNGRNPQEANFVVVNKQHPSRNKRYYVVETQEILTFLQMYDNLNLQKIRPEQLNELKEKGLVKDSNIQNPGEYKQNATIFIDSRGQIRCKKVSSYMKTLGIWK